MSVEFYKPSDLQSVVELMENYGDRAIVVNGGTDIVVEIAHKRISPDAIVYMDGISSLREISEEAGIIRLGGAVTYLAMQKSPICNRITGLMCALAHLGSPAVRAVATPAGNLGTAAPSADCTTMLMALESKIVLASIKGERVVPIEEFFLGRGRTAMASNEIIKEIRFLAPLKNFGTGYSRIARRKAQDIAKILSGVSIYVENDVCTRATISLGALNATAVRASSIELAIIGKNYSDAMQYTENNFPIEAGLRQSYFKHYKELVTPSIISRALDMAWQSVN